MKMWTVNNIEKEENKNTKAKWSKYEKKKLTAFTGKNRLLWEEEQKNMKHNEITLGFLSFSFFFFQREEEFQFYVGRHFNRSGTYRFFSFHLLKKLCFIFSQWGVLLQLTRNLFVKHLRSQMTELYSNGYKGNHNLRGKNVDDICKL